MLIELQDRAAVEKMLGEKGRQIVVFTTADCPACRMSKPALLDFAEENTVYTVNLSEHPAIARSFSVRSVPTVLLFEDGMEKGRRIGAFNRQHLQRMQDGVPLGRL